MHDLRASDGENAPWRQDVRAAYSPAALCGAFWMHGAHILPKLAESEYMAAICCHEPVFFPSEAPSGTHRGDILPRQTAWERIETIYCRGQEPGVHGTAHVVSRAGAAGLRAELQAQGGAAGRTGAAARRGGMYGAAANAGDRHPQREGRGRRRMARFPHQNKGSRPTPSSPKQKKASALLAFFRCSVYDSNDPRNLHGNKPLPFGILSD